MVTITHHESSIARPPMRSLPPGAGLFIGGAVSLGLWAVIAAIVVIV